MTRMRHLMAGVVMTALAACASAPIRYYTLVPPPDEGQSAAPAANFQFELLPVGVPAQDDVPQLVVRQGAQSVALLDGERWIAPLADELRSALSVDLARRTRAQDIGGGLPPDGKPVVRIKVDLHRFDSSPGHYARIDATWTVRLLKGQAMLTCSTRVTESVGQGYNGLVAGHQRALATLADHIADVAPALAEGRTPACPAD